MKHAKFIAGVTTMVAAGLVLAACGSSGGSVGAKSADSGKVTAGDAWTREITTPSGEAAVYLKVTNGTGAAVRITGASVPGTVASSASLHESMAADSGGAAGQMTMQPLGSITVDAHRTVRFVPGGKHIMLEGVKKSFSAGDTFTLTLKRGSGKDLRTTVTVRST